MSSHERDGRECPNCGRITARGELQCENCGEQMAIGPLSGQSPTTLLWAGRLAAVAAVIAPVIGLVAVLLALSLWTVHDEQRDAAQTAIAGLVFGAIGYVANGGFLLV